jgi:hypothetical protein
VIYAKVKEFPNVTFSITLGDDSISDTLCSDVWSGQLEGEIREIVNQVYGDNKYIHAYVFCDKQTYEEIPSYNEMLYAGLVIGAKVRVSVPIDYSAKHRSDALSSLYSVMKKQNSLEPLK